MPNRLAESPSLYLRQHADNPVDWWPWGPEAMAEALGRDVPILLSVGYASCHWCHVMAHESFENFAIAETVNRYFLPIKLDREEHPEVDDAYMQAVLMANGHGGWPMTVFCLPTGEPLFAGTYFPPEDRGDRMGFGSLIERISALWKHQRADLEEAAKQFATALRESPRLEAQPLESLPDRLLEALADDFDSVHGGFGRAPKFPPHSAVGFLQSLGELPMVQLTLNRMAEGGIHDRVAGGFHRYSTDGEWRLPHFEKTLYDNALLLKQFAGPGGDQAVAQGIVDWLEAEMRLPNGLYASALDADSDGEEGLFYTWRYDEVPGGERYGMRPEGNFRDEATGQYTGQNVLLHVPIGDKELANLAAIRSRRSRPSRDDKAIVGWNAMAASGLIAAGQPEFAERILDSIQKHFVSNVPRCIYGDVAVGEGTLEDYAYVAQAFLDADRESEARRIADLCLEKTWDETEGGFFSAVAAPFGRKKSWTDSPTPSANAVMATVLYRLGDFDRAEATIKAGSGWMARIPLATEAMHAAAIAIFPPVARWVDAAFIISPPRGSVVKIEGMDVELPIRYPNRVTLTYQVCRGEVCELPVTISRPSRS